MSGYGSGQKVQHSTGGNYQMPDTEFTFRVGMALGRALTQPTYPTLAVGRDMHFWSEPDALGYRHLLTVRLSAAGEGR